MTAKVVFIDHDHAHIYSLGQDAAKNVNLTKHEVRHHTSHDAAKKKDSSALYHDVAAQLKAATEVLVIGHGTAKDQFVHHVKDHHHQDLAKKIVGVETVDNPTDNQVMALARKFFKAHHLFV